MVLWDINELLVCGLLCRLLVGGCSISYELCLCQCWLVFVYFRKLFIKGLLFSSFGLIVWNFGCYCMLVMKYELVVWIVLIMLFFVVCVLMIRLLFSWLIVWWWMFVMWLLVWFLYSLFRCELGLKMMLWWCWLYSLVLMWVLVCLSCVVMFWYSDLLQVMLISWQLWQIFSIGLFWVRKFLSSFILQWLWVMLFDYFGCMGCWLQFVGDMLVLFCIIRLLSVLMQWCMVMWWWFILVLKFSVGSISVIVL